MAYTFGAATGNDINWTTASSGGNSTVCLAAGWFYPTTLTATRGLFSYGNVCGVAIDTTTSELRLKTDNTTDGQWTTSGVGLAVDKWSFIAFMLTCSNTGPTAAWRVWSGTFETAPVERTVTQAVAPSGNFTAGTSFTVGNIGTGTIAFQGDIGPVLTCHPPAINSTTGFIQNAAAGAITQDEADDAYRNVVLPFWKGEPMPFRVRQYGLQTGSTMGAFLNLDNALPSTQEVVSGATLVSRAPTINGATPSQNRAPRVYETTAAQPWGGRPLSRR